MVYLFNFKMFYLGYRKVFRGKVLIKFEVSDVCFGRLMYILN